MNASLPSKEAIIDFFDRRAREWDLGNRRDDAKIRAILAHAGVARGKRVLDVACGTGVLFPDYLALGVESVTAVDISPEMARIARGKAADARVEVLCADATELPFRGRFDCAVVYNAFPHFPDPSLLLARLAEYVVPGGRITVAHGMGRAWIDAHHGGAARGVSVGLMHERELASLLSRSCHVDTIVSNDDMFLVSGAVLDA